MITASFLIMYLGGPPLLKHHVGTVPRALSPVEGYTVVKLLESAYLLHGQRGKPGRLVTGYNGLSLWRGARLPRSRLRRRAGRLAPELSCRGRWKASWPRYRDTRIVACAHLRQPRRRPCITLCPSAAAVTETCSLEIGRVSVDTRARILSRASDKATRPHTLPRTSVHFIEPRASCCAWSRWTLYTRLWDLAVPHSFKC